MRLINNFNKGFEKWWATQHSRQRRIARRHRSSHRLTLRPSAGIQVRRGPPTHRPRSRPSKLISTRLPSMLPKRPVQTLKLSHHHQLVKATRQPRELVTRAKVLMLRVDPGTSTIHLEKLWDTWLSSLTTTTSTETRANSTHWSRNIKLNCASTSWITTNVHLHNIVNSHTDKRISDSPTM